MRDTSSMSCLGATSGFASTTAAVFAIWTSWSGASNVCGAIFCSTRGVGPAPEEDVDDVAESAEVALVAPLDSEEDGVDDEALGADGVDSGADGVAEPLLGVGCSLPLELGAIASGDRGAALLGVAESEVAGLGLGELSVVGLFVVDVTGGGVLAVDDGASLVAGAGESCVGAAGAAVRDEGGATALGCTALGCTALGCTALGCAALGCAAEGAAVCAGSTLGTTTGAGATVGTSAAVGRSAGASRVAAGASRGAAGSGTTVVVGADGSSPGLANAGATPPVSAVNETTIPDARTAHTVRRRQIFNDAPTVQRLLLRYPPTLATDQPLLGHRSGAGFVTGYPQVDVQAERPRGGRGCTRRPVRRTGRRPGGTPPPGPRA